MSDIDWDAPYAHVSNLGSVKYQQNGMYFLQDGTLFDGDPDTGLPWPGDAPQVAKVVQKPVPKKRADLAALYGEEAAA